MRAAVCQESEVCVTSFSCLYRLPLILSSDVAYRLAGDLKHHLLGVLEFRLLGVLEFEFEFELGTFLRGPLLSATIRGDAS